VVALQALLILDGAAERPGAGPTSLERAHTPALDALCARGRVRALRTIPAGLAPGSETGTPTLLGHPPAAQPSRGLIEAAAAGIEVPQGASAWRCDLYRDGARHSPPRPARTARELDASAPGHRAVHLRGHRFLLVGHGRPDPRLSGLELCVWGDGSRLSPALDSTTVMICGPGAAAGIAISLGARVRIPPTATGATRTDLGAKRRAALDELRRGARVVVHVAAPDEAAHERDPSAKIAALEAIDAELIGPLAATVLARGGRFAVSPDHGTDPATGEHLSDPVPSVLAGPGVPPLGPERLVERSVESELLEVAR
jgi:2,3-bisphosphoglycerate-independent phosphoglycerate mutase